MLGRKILRLVGLWLSCQKGSPGLIFALLLLLNLDCGVIRPCYLWKLCLTVCTASNTAHPSYCSWRLSWINTSENCLTSEQRGPFSAFSAMYVKATIAHNVITSKIIHFNCFCFYEWDIQDIQYELTKWQWTVWLVTDWSFLFIIPTQSHCTNIYSKGTEYQSFF